MTRAGIVLANLRRRKRRTLLTIMGVAIAMFLFITLRSVLTTLADSDEVGSENRLIVSNKTGFTFTLPLAYRTRLSSVPGVSGVSWAQWFGGMYIEPRNFFAQFAVDPESYLGLYPEIVVPEDQKQAWLNEQTAALVGRGLVERFGWQLGQTINLRGTIFRPGEDWPFTIRAIYESGRDNFPDNTMYLHYEYLEQAFGGEFGEAGSFVLAIEDPSRAAEIAASIDASYENSAAATKTQTEGAYNLGFVGLYGNIGFFLNTIGMAVVFAILLVAANTMAMSARERIPEIAVLKTVGFTDRAVFAIVLGEAFAIAMLGAGLGLAGALAVFNLGAFDFFNFIPGLAVAGRTMLLTAGIALLLTLASGLIPARAAGRLNVVEALRHVA
jgi:putative ABC transport system permease protein